MFDRQDDCGRAIPVSASLYLPAQDCIVCGREDGSIVIISAARAAIAQLLKLPGSGTLLSAFTYNFLYTDYLVIGVLRDCFLASFCSGRVIAVRNLPK